MSFVAIQSVSWFGDANAESGCGAIYPFDADGSLLTADSTVIKADSTVVTADQTTF